MWRNNYTVNSIQAKPPNGLTNNLGQWVAKYFFHSLLCTVMGKFMFARTIFHKFSVVFLPCIQPVHFRNDDRILVPNEKRNNWSEPSPNVMKIDTHQNLMLLN